MNLLYANSITGVADETFGGNFIDGDLPKINQTDMGNNHRIKIID